MQIVLLVQNKYFKFPTIVCIGYLVWQLEQVNCELNASRTHVQNTLFRLGVSVTRLVDIYKA